MKAKLNIEKILEKGVRLRGFYKNNSTISYTVNELKYTIFEWEAHENKSGVYVSKDFLIATGKKQEIHIDNLILANNYSNFLDKLNEI